MNEDTQIVTFITDLGTRDYYVGMIKGAIVSHHRNVNLIDITHDVKSFDIVQASFILKNTYLSYPKGTIHILSVNNYYSKKRRFIAFEHHGHYFVGPDNGVFSLVFGEELPSVYLLEENQEMAFSIKEVFANAVHHIASRQSLATIGKPLGRIVQRITLQPVITRYQIMGSVIHIDKYGNCVVNVSQALFERTKEERRFAIFFKRNNPIIKLSKNYYDVPVGEPLCLFNSAGYLEIGINMGTASSLLNLNIDDMVQIDFL